MDVMSGHEKNCEEVLRYTTMLQLPLPLMQLAVLAPAASAVVFPQTPALVCCSVLFAPLVMHPQPASKDNKVETFQRKWKL